MIDHKTSHLWLLIHYKTFFYYSMLKNFKCYLNRISPLKCNQKPGVQTYIKNHPHKTTWNHARQHQTTQNHKKPCETSWKPTKPQLHIITWNHAEPCRTNQERKMKKVGFIFASNNWGEKNTVFKKQSSFQSLLRSIHFKMEIKQSLFNCLAVI